MNKKKSQVSPVLHEYPVSRRYTSNSPPVVLFSIHGFLESSNFDYGVMAYLWQIHKIFNFKHQLWFPKLDKDPENSKSQNRFKLNSWEMYSCRALANPYVSTEILYYKKYFVGNIFLGSSGVGRCYIWGGGWGVELQGHVFLWFKSVFLWEITLLVCPQKLWGDPAPVAPLPTLLSGILYLSSFNI